MLITSHINMANNNPAIFSPTEIKAIKRKLLESSGINPHSLGGDEPIQSIQEVMGQQMQMKQGGSLPRQAPSQVPQTNPTVATV